MFFVYYIIYIFIGIIIFLLVSALIYLVFSLIYPILRIFVFEKIENIYDKYLDLLRDLKERLEEKRKKDTEEKEK